jgi:catechol 2,3-dioxygenase-like lactoylglutathione lyase family enzyme
MERARVMIDHVYISVTNIEKSLAFYLAALKPLGWREFGNYDAASGPDTVPDLHGIGDHTYVSGTGVGSSVGSHADHADRRMRSLSVAQLVH